MAETKMKREDLATNLDMHIGDIRDFARKNDLTLAAAFQHYSPDEQEDGQDALLETMERRGLRTTSDDYGASSDLGELYKRDSGSDFGLAVAYLQQVFRSNVTGMQPRSEYQPLLDPTNLDGAQEFAVNSITDIPRSWAPYDMGAIEQERMVVPSLRLNRILGKREFVTTANFEVPVFDANDDEGNIVKPIAPGAELPIITVDTSEETTKPDKVGYALQFPYEFFLNNRITIQTIAYFQRQRAALQEIAIVDQALSLLSSELTAVLKTGGFNVVQFIDVICDPDANDMVKLDVCVAERHTYLTFAAWMNNFFMTSAQQTPALPGFRPMFRDMPIGEFDVYRKEPGTITDLAASGTAGVRFLFFDSRQCLHQIIQRGGNVSETDRNIMTQTRQITNTFLYKVRTMASATNAAVLGNIAN